MTRQTQNSFLISFNEVTHEINLDELGYIRLNDLIKFFPNKRVDNWMRLDTTKEFIKTIDKQLHHENNNFLNKAFYAIKGNSEEGILQGTYAHKYLAFEFLTWLSLEFKILVIKKLENLYNEPSLKIKQIEKKSNRFQKIIDEVKKSREKHKLVDILDKLNKYEVRIQLVKKEVEDDS